jgi:sugar phosphate permease
MTVVSAAVPVGGAIITPLLAVAVSRWGWRWGAFMSGTLFLVVGLPLCFGVRRSPESMGMEPDGEPLQRAKKLDGGLTQEPESHNEPDITTRQAMRTRIFWLLVVSMMARSAAFTTVTTHFIHNGLERPKSDPSICSARGICHLQLAPSLRAGVDW